MLAPSYRYVQLRESLPAYGWGLALLGMLSLTACGEAKPDARRTEGGPAECEPNCEAGCGADDGCGASCPCPGDSCSQGRPCPDPECGVCAASESCTAGKCVCEPTCGPGRACLADGCGGTCACPDGLVENAKGQWVPPDECTDNCAVAGWSCGKLCGQECGGCTSGACELGKCARPRCDGTRCDNGCACKDGKMCAASGECLAPAACLDTCESASASCGSICGTVCGQGGCDGSLSCIAGKCGEAVSCATCSLKLSLIEKTVYDGRVLEAVLALDYQPVEGEPRPRLADLRIAIEGDAELTSVEPGPSLVRSGKQLYVDSQTQQPFKRRPDGSYQLIAYGVGTTSTFLPGRLLTLRFAHSESAPLAFSLLRREQVLAPQLADAALQTSAYDGLVVVTP